MRLTPFRSDKSKPLSFAARYAATRTSHLMFLGSTIIYAIVGLLAKAFLMPKGSGFANLPNPTYSALFAMLSVLSIVLVCLVLVLLPRRAAAQGPVAGPGVSSLIEVGQELVQRHAMRMQLSEPIAIFGLVLFMCNGSLPTLLLFTGTTIALLLATYPRRAQWDEARWQAEQRGITEAR